ncbi:MAG: inositol monophosphatase family protein [Candidatus Omnitrophota bacterium]|jgi:myo-inositol-1(or 4)-monophosphatase
MDKFRRTAIGAALKSGLFIKRSVGKIKEISYKGKINIVTDVDKSAEAMIIKAISRSFPGHSILSEESEPRNNTSPYRWVIDPLDGTTNFAHAFPFFCVSIALEKDGKAILGVVYDPMRDELFTAEEDRGAFLNKKKLHVSGTKKLSDGFLATGFAYGVQDARNTNIRNFKNFLMRAMAIRRAGAAALDMCYVACGRFDGFWEMDLKPWDSAAAYLIVKEAGGRITKFDGSKFTPYDNEVLATNGLIHRDMVRVLSTGR